MPSQAGSRELARISRRFLPLIPAVGRIEAALLADLPGGGRQTVLLLNEDPSSLPSKFGPDFYRMLNLAYCGS